MDGKKHYLIEVLVTVSGEFGRGDLTSFNQVDWESQKFRDRCEILSHLGGALERISLLFPMTVVIGATNKNTGIIIVRIGGTCFSRLDEGDVHWFHLSPWKEDAFLNGSFEDIKKEFLLRFRDFCEEMEGEVGRKILSLEKKLVENSVIAIAIDTAKKALSSPEEE